MLRLSFSSLYLFIKCRSLLETSRRIWRRSQSLWKRWKEKWSSSETTSSSGPLRTPMSNPSLAIGIKSGYVLLHLPVPSLLSPLPPRSPLLPLIINIYIYLFSDWASRKSNKGEEERGVLCFLYQHCSIFSCSSGTSLYLLYLFISFYIFLSLFILLSMILCLFHLENSSVYRRKETAETKSTTKGSAKGTTEDREGIKQTIKFQVLFLPLSLSFFFLLYLFSSNSCISNELGSSSEVPKGNWKRSSTNKPENKREDVVRKMYRQSVKYMDVKDLRERREKVNFLRWIKEIKNRIEKLTPWGISYFGNRRCAALRVMRCAARCVLWLFLLVPHRWTYDISHHEHHLTSPTLLSLHNIQDIHHVRYAVQRGLYRTIVS